MNAPLHTHGKVLLPHAFLGILPLYSAQDPIQKGLLVCLTPQTSSLPYLTGFAFFSACSLLPLLGPFLSWPFLSAGIEKKIDTFSSSQLLTQDKMLMLLFATGIFSVVIGKLRFIFIFRCTCSSIFCLVLIFRSQLATSGQENFQPVLTKMLLTLQLWHEWVTFWK